MDRFTVVNFLFCFVYDPPPFGGGLGGTPQGFVFRGACGPQWPTGTAFLWCPMSIGDLVFDESPDCVSRTKQSFKDECDINKIVARYAAGGDVSGLAIKQGRFTNASLTQDFKASQDAIADLRSIYESRPDLYKDFPTVGHFMTAFEDPDRFDLLVKAGLLGPEALTKRSAAIEAARAKANADAIAATAATNAAVIESPGKGGRKKGGDADEL